MQLCPTLDLIGRIQLSLKMSRKLKIYTLKRIERLDPSPILFTNPFPLPIRHIYIPVIRKMNSHLLTVLKPRLFGLPGVQLVRIRKYIKPTVRPSSTRQIQVLQDMEPYESNYNGERWQPLVVGKA